MPKNTGALWDKNWIQGYESVWGITEKFKLANVLSGDELLLVIGNEEIQRKETIVNTSYRFRELITMSYLSMTETNKYFGVDLIKYNENLINKVIHVFPDKTQMFSLFYPALSYCKTCMKEGYHSIFHQIRLFDHCAFHPDEKLIITCSYCKKIFRDYCVGNKEEAFCCQHCKRSIINDFSLQSMKQKWKSLKIIKNGVVEDWLNIPQEAVNKYNYYFHSGSLSAFELVNGTSNNYSDFPRLFNRFFYNKENKSNISPNYPSIKLQNKDNYVKYQEADNKYRWNYLYQELFDQFLDKTINVKANFRELNLSLDYECFIQSKAILKAAERYILNKRIRTHRECVKKFFNEDTEYLKCVYAKAFVEWKSECYGYGFETWRIERVPGIRSPKFYYENWTDRFQIYSKANFVNHLDTVLRHFSRNRCNYQFKTIIYLMNTLLFKNLVIQFEQYVDIFKKDPHYNKYPQENLPLFIIAVSTSKKELYILS